MIEKILERLEEEREIAEKELEKCIFKGLPYHDSTEGKIIGIKEAIEIVKQEAEKYNNGWIPCSERLPKYGEVVMCSCTNSGITISCITHKGVKPSKSVRFGQHSVIAWQPLPSPYQPKGE